MLKLQERGIPKDNNWNKRVEELLCKTFQILLKGSYFSIDQDKGQFGLWGISFIINNISTKFKLKKKIIICNYHPKRASSIIRSALSTSLILFFWTTGPTARKNEGIVNPNPNTRAILYAIANLCVILYRNNILIMNRAINNILLNNANKLFAWDASDAIKKTGPVLF